jgi:hypothetical protein
MTDRSGGRSAAFCHSPRSHDRAVAPAVFVFLLAPSSAARPAPDAPPVNARRQQFPIRRHWRYAVSGQHDIKRRSFARPSAAGCALPKDPMLLRWDAGAKGRSQLCGVREGPRGRTAKGQMVPAGRAVVLGFCAGVFLLAAVVETSLAAPTAPPSAAPCPLCPQPLSPASSVRAARAGPQH